MINDLNFSEMNEFTICNENIESIFVEITCSNKPITVGVLCRLPSGDLRLFNKELKAILSKLSDNNCYILGDYNVNLFINLNTKSQQDSKEIVISNGYCLALTSALFCAGARRRSSPQNSSRIRDMDSSRIRDITVHVYQFPLINNLDVKSVY